MPDLISIHLNGEPVRIERGTLLEDLVRSRGHSSEQVAVEVNHELVPRKARSEHPLQPGDRVEFVTLVGGG